jgi:adenylosuccinate synthase
MVNGVTDLAVTILDGLDERETLKICVGYNIDGEIHEFPPAERDHWDKIVPVYQEMPGWQQSTSGCRSYQDLPAAARDYLDRIEELTGARVSYIGVGPDREQTIIR